MPDVTRDATDIITSVTGSDVLTTVRLPQRGRLVRVTFASLGGRQNAVFVTVDAVVGAHHQLLTSGWVRGGNTPTQLALVWEGEVPLGGGYDTFLRFVVANDTGADFDWQGAWLVEHDP